MKLDKILLSALAVAGLCFSGCKDPKDDEYFDFHGSISVPETLPYYVNPGDAIAITPGGLSKDPDDRNEPEILYYVVPTPFSYTKDTTSYYEFTFPDSLCTASIEVYGAATGYNPTSSSYKITVVNPERSLTQIEFDPDGDVFTDERDGRKYHYTTIAGKDWMSQNLAYCGFGKAYKGIKPSGYEAMTDIFGMYYTWDEANSACPDGWHLPTDQEWTEMCQTLTDTPLKAFDTFPGIAGKLMTNGYLNREKLWTYYTIMHVDPTASYMNIMPTGYANKSESTYIFEDTKNFAAFWTASEDDSEKAFCRYLRNNPDAADVFVESLFKDNVATPVRCVREAQ